MAMAARIAARSVARPASQISRAAEDSFRVSSQRALMLAHLHRDNAEAAGLEGFARKLSIMESAPPDATPLRHRQHALGVIATFLKGLGEHSAAKSYAIESVQLVPTPQVSEQARGAPQLNISEIPTPGFPEITTPGFYLSERLANGDITLNLSQIDL